MDNVKGKSSEPNKLEAHIEHLRDQIDVAFFGLAIGSAIGTAYIAWVVIAALMRII